MLRAMGSLAARWVGVLALVIAVLATVPAAASAQLLERSSDAVRGRRGASEPRAGTPRRSEAPRTGSVTTARPPPPRASTRRDGSPQADRAAPPRHPGDRPARAWPRWSGSVWVPGELTTSSSTTTVEPPPVAPEPAARDPLYGGSAGVRVVGTIGLPPREPLEAPPPGAPVGTTTLVVQGREAPARPPVRGVIGFDAGYVLHGVGRGALSVRLELPPMIDLVLGYSGYLEPTGGGFDAIALGRLGVGARLVDEEVAQVRLAVAARHFHDWLGPSFGVEAQLAIDVEVYEATVLVIEGSLGTLGETFSAQVRASLGLRPTEDLELYAGYDHLVLQPFSAEASAVELGGPMAGLRVTID